MHTLHVYSLKNTFKENFVISYMVIDINKKEILMTFRNIKENLFPSFVEVLKIVH